MLMPRGSEVYHKSGFDNVLSYSCKTINYI